MPPCMSDTGACIGPSSSCYRCSIPHACVILLTCCVDAGPHASRSYAVFRPAVDNDGQIVSVSGLPDDSRLKRQMEEFIRYMQAPIQLNRNEPRVMQDTLRSYISTISLFMGYLRVHKKIMDADLNLHLLTSQHLLVEFWSFKLQVGVDVSTRLGHACTQAAGCAPMHARHLLLLDSGSARACAAVGKLTQAVPHEQGTPPQQGAHLPAGHHR